MAAQGAEPVWIDTDISIGSPLREVDDAFALLVALHSPGCRIIGISTSYGNASRRSADRAASELIGRFGSLGRVSRADIYPGADRAEDLGRESPASMALAGALRRRRLTYLALGPLTNLATLRRLHPDLGSRVKRVIFVGGTFPGERLVLGHNEAFHFHDANTLKDPDAVKEVLRSDIPILLLPVTVAQTLTITPNDLHRLAADSESGRYLASGSGTWMWFWRNIGGAEGGALFDVAAAVAFLQPKLLTTADRYVGVEPNRSLVVRKVRSGKEDKRVKCCLGIKSAARAFYLRALQAP